MDDKLLDPARTIDISAEDIVSESLRSQLKQMTRIHHTMFERLLEGEGELPSAIAALLEDAGTAYLRVARAIGEDRSLGP